MNVKTPREIVDLSVKRSISHLGLLLPTRELCIEYTQLTGLTMVVMSSTS